MDVTFRPLPSWPYPGNEGNRRGFPFSATFTQTMGLLRTELGNLGASDVLIGLCVPNADISSRSGWPKESTRPFHPGVELSFESKTQKRRLVYATDVCSDWQQNLRSIALGLQALRAVDRYGITRRGEQYAGFVAITAGGPDPETGKRLVEAAGGITEALRRHHPDVGGDPRNFAHVQAYREQQGGGR